MTPPYRRPSPPSSSRNRRGGAPPEGSQAWQAPWVQIRYFSFHPNIFPNMITAASPDAKAGDVVTVYDKEGQPFGHGFFNPRARVPLRIFRHGAEPLAADFWQTRLQEAIDLRKNMLDLDSCTEAYRVVHADADGIPGLVVDKYGDTLSIETSNVGAYEHVGEWLPTLHQALGTTKHVIHFDEAALRAEDVFPQNLPSYADLRDETLKEVRIRENGVRYGVNFESGHKTGFFCDQRDNRRQFAQWVKGKRVLDACCYTGGFAISAKVLGGATEVTGVDLDETAIAQAQRNANLNQTRVNFVHSDAFAWMRQMQRNGETWEAIVLDPPKLIHSREGYEEGEAKYHDLNKLALSLVARGGLFVTCSCSGLMPVAEFEDLIIRIAHRLGKKLQILDRTGPGPDHPVMSHCPESRYLKAIWARVW